MNSGVQQALWGAIYFGAPVILFGFIVRMLLYRSPRYNHASKVRLVLFLLFPTSLSVVLSPFLLPVLAQYIDDFMFLGFISLPTVLTELLGSAAVAALCRNQTRAPR